MFFPDPIIKDPFITVTANGQVAWVDDQGNFVSLHNSVPLHFLMASCILKVRDSLVESFPLPCRVIVALSLFVLAATAGVVEVVARVVMALAISVFNRRCASNEWTCACIGALWIWRYLYDVQIENFASDFVIPSLPRHWTSVVATMGMVGG